MASLVALAQGGLFAGRPWLRRLLVPVVFVVCFAIFAFLTFPFDSLKASLEEQVHAGGGELTIERLRPAGLGGVRATGVKLRLPQGPGEGPLPELKLDHVDVRPDFFAFLLRRISFGFAFEGYGGKAKGHAALAKDQAQGLFDSLDVDAADLDLKQLPMKELSGLDLTGQLTLKTRLTRLSPADGATSILMKGGAVNGGQLRGFTLPKMNLGELDAQVVSDKGAARIERAMLRGSDVEADADGTLRLKPLLSLSQADLHARFKLSESWLNVNPVFRGLLTALNNARQPDGGFVFTLTGPMSNLNSRPGR